MKVKIVKIRDWHSYKLNNYYDQFVGQIFEVITKQHINYLLPIPTSDGVLKNTLWGPEEVEEITE